MSDSPELEFTGERFTPECVREIAYEHWHRYAWARQLVAGKDVLDAACGEGYGSALLSQRAAQVTGGDIDAEAVAHAERRYQATNLTFQRADCTDLPMASASVDVVVSFETLEHLAAQDELLTEFRRVLRPEGFLLISSPDKKTYSDQTGYRNPFHVRELYRDEFESLLGRHFPAWRLYGQKLMFASAIWSIADAASSEWLSVDDMDVSAGKQPVHPPMYFLAAAAARVDCLPDIPGTSLFDDRQESVYAHYNEEIAKHIRAGKLLAERDAEIAELRARLEQG